MLTQLPSQQGHKFRRCAQLKISQQLYVFA